MIKKFLWDMVLRLPMQTFTLLLMKSQSLNQPISSGSRMKTGLEIQRFLTILPSKIEKEMIK